MTQVEASLNELLLDYLQSTGRRITSIAPSDNLISDLELKSDEGLDLAMDIEDLFQVVIPPAVNPIVNEGEQHGVTFAELVEIVENFITNG